MKTNQGNPKMAVISTVHETYDTRIFYKQIFSLREHYDIRYFSPLVGPAPYDWIIPLKKKSSKVGRLSTHFSLLMSLPRFKADLYLLHDPELLPLGIVLKLLGRKVVWDMHEDTYNDIKTKGYLSPVARRVLASVYRLFQDLSYRLFDGFVLAEDEYGSYFSAADKTCVVHNYPLLERLEDYVGIDKAPGSIVYIGSISVNRGVYQLLDLVARLGQTIPDVKLTLIGPFTDSALERGVRLKLGELGISENVEILGPVKNIEAYPLVARCRVGLSLLLPEPNFAKSLPTKMFEYMALGLPVVVSNFPLWERIVSEPRSGIAVDPGDTSAVVAAVSRLLTDEPFYAQLSENARQVAQAFSWSAESAVLHRFLESRLSA